MTGLLVLITVVICMLIAWEGFKISDKAHYQHQWKYLGLGMLMVLGSAAVAVAVTMSLIMK